MTICLTCNRYLMDASTCTADSIRFPDGKVADALPYGQETDPPVGERCPECGVERGGFHHPGCPVAECPRCGEPLDGCGCLDGE